MSEVRLRDAPLVLRPVLWAAWVGARILHRRGARWKDAVGRSSYAVATATVYGIAWLLIIFAVVVAFLIST